MVSQTGVQAEVCPPLLSASGSQSGVSEQQPHLETLIEMHTCKPRCTEPQT